MGSSIRQFHLLVGNSAHGSRQKLMTMICVIAICKSILLQLVIGGICLRSWEIVEGPLSAGGVYFINIMSTMRGRRRSRWQTRRKKRRCRCYCCHSTTRSPKNTRDKLITEWLCVVPSSQWNYGQEQLQSLASESSGLLRTGSRFDSK